MACGCQKNGTTPTGMGKTPDASADARARADAQAKARAANPSVSRMGAPAARTASGVSQTFALDRGGSRLTYGSRLERDADLARRGGTAV